MAILERKQQVLGALATSLGKLSSEQPPGALSESWQRCELEKFLAVVGSSDADIRQLLCAAGVPRDGDGVVCLKGFIDWLYTDCGAAPMCDTSFRIGDNENNEYDNAEKLRQQSAGSAGRQVVFPQTGVVSSRQVSSETRQMSAETDRKRQQSAESNWSGRKATELQEAVDVIFSKSPEALLGLEFSFTIADVTMEDTPLIGCSIGFTRLVGYDLDEIVGRNCRFLIDPVPGELIDSSTRRRSKDFCKAARDEEPWMATSDYPYWPTGTPCDELICVQVNARKDGTLFNNLFLMKVFYLSAEMGEEKPYIVALQSELPEEGDNVALMANNMDWVKSKMEEVKTHLSSILFMECDMAREVADP